MSGNIMSLLYRSTPCHDLFPIFDQIVIIRVLESITLSPSVF